eukprot:scaffold618_cov130-Cylindrotheca_fusiformis.AAC.11
MSRDLELPLLALAVPSESFVAKSATSMKRTQSSWKPLAAMAMSEQVAMLAGKVFQLEEREDRDTEQTRIWLHPDGTVKLEDTDGPQFTSAEGRWSIVNSPDSPFRMLIDRTYTGGMERKEVTDVGEFDYTVRREFVGDVQAIGKVADVEGVVYLLDKADQREFEVGYFAMIDCSDPEED